MSTKQWPPPKEEKNGDYLVCPKCGRTMEVLFQVPICPNCDFKNTEKDEDKNKEKEKRQRLIYVFLEKCGGLIT